MSFQNYGIQQNTVKNNTTTNQPPLKKQNTTISKNVFKESLVHLDKQWDKWTNEMNALKTDAAILERMFNSYDKDSKYLELRDSILKKLNLKNHFYMNLKNKYFKLK